MHMARLWDSSRTMGKGYSLEALTGAAPPGFLAAIVLVSVVKLFSWQHKKNGARSRFVCWPEFRKGKAGNGARLTGLAMKV